MPLRRIKCLYFDGVNVEDLIRLTQCCESDLGGVQLFVMHGHGRQADPQDFHLRMFEERKRIAEDRLCWLQKRKTASLTLMELHSRWALSHWPLDTNCCNLDG